MNTIFCIVGESGSGKTSLVEYLQMKYNLKSIDSYTTRPPRYPNESGHIFVTDKEYQEMKNDIVAYTYFNSYHYWATSQQIDENDLYVVDWAGVEELQEKYKGNKRVISVFLDVPWYIRFYRMYFKRKDKISKIISRMWNDYKMFKGVSDKCTFSIPRNHTDIVSELLEEYIESEEINE